MFVGDIAGMGKAAVDWLFLIQFFPHYVYESYPRLIEKSVQGPVTTGDTEGKNVKAGLKDRGGTNGSPVAAVSRESKEKPQKTMNQHFLLLALPAVLLLAACEKEQPVQCPAPPAAEFRVYEFGNRANGDTFLAWTSDTAVIAQVAAQLALPAAERMQHINGQLARIPAGCDPINKNWSWYFVPNEWHLADASMEICDGNPRYVEDHLDDYLAFERYCPWSSYVIRDLTYALPE